MVQNKFMSAWIHAGFIVLISLLGLDNAHADRHRVVNSTNPAGPALTNGTSELWRISTSNDVLFAPIYDITRDGQGNSYLLDPQMCHVHVISPNGKYLRAIGREGEGPGEFRSPRNVMLLPGGEVCVLQVVPGRAIKLSPDGEAMGDHPLPRGEGGNPLFVNEGDIAAGQLVLKLGDFIQKESSLGLNTLFVRIDIDGEIKTTYWEFMRERDFANTTFDEKADAEPVWAVSSDGYFYINNKWDAYTVEVYDPDGESKFVIEHEYKHRKRTALDLAQFDGPITRGEMAPSTVLSETSRDIKRLFPRSNGNLWILSSRGALDISEETVATFDEFDSTGYYARQITVKGPYNPYRDLFYLVDEYVYIVVNGGEGFGEEGEESTDEPRELEVICLHLDEKG